MLKRCRNALRPTPLFAMKVAPIRDWPLSRNGRLRRRRIKDAVAPLAVAHRDAKDVLEAKLAGNFPGGLVTLEFSFWLEDGEIVSLEIH